MKKRISKNNRIKKDLGKRSKRVIGSQRSKNKNIKKGSGSKYNTKTLKKPQIELEEGMIITGVVRKIRVGGRGAALYVVPSSRRMPFDILLTPPFIAGEGEMVEARLTKIGGRGADATAKITKVFGAADSLSANYNAILSSYGIESEFGASVLREAQEVSCEELSAEGREDLRGELIFTIDGADAKDLDDAISLKKLEDGWELSVHIADVSHYVREGSELDREAKTRGTSVYFTDKVVSMLPPIISNGCCSLNRDSDKYALSAHIKLDKNANIKGLRLSKSIISSVVRGVYSEINDIYQHGKKSEFYPKYAHVYETLLDMKKVYEKREAIAFSRGYVELDTAEGQILLGEDGIPCEIVKRARGIGERLIEQFMLCANEAVAVWLSEKKYPCVYRIHETPDEEKITAFKNFLHNLGVDSSVLYEGNVTAKAYSRILEAAEKKGISDIVSDVMLRSFMKARYSNVRSGHFGLALDYYCHFTSPIRRYPDLSVHRIISAAISKNPDSAKRYFDFARESAIKSSDNEIRALGAERSIEDLYKTVYMKAHEGEEYDARITSVQSFGFFATLDNTCEGLVSVSSLDGFFVYSESANSLSNKKTSYTLGQKVRIRVKYADIARHKTEFEVAL